MAILLYFFLINSIIRGQSSIMGQSFEIYNKLPITYPMSLKFITKSRGTKVMGFITYYNY